MSEQILLKEQVGPALAATLAGRVAAIHPTFDSSAELGEA